MIRYLIKNNFKIMFRNPVNILLYVLCPILIGAFLSSAFSSLMESYKAPGEFEVGYSIEADSPYAGVISAMDSIGKENGITFNRYDTGTPEDLMGARELGGFIVFTKEGYTVYESKKRQVEGAKLEYMISAVYNGMISGDVSDIQIPSESPEVAPAINSTDYYGMVYMVYFGWCAIVCAAGLFAQEKKHLILDRFRISNLSPAQIYFGRAIPIVTVVSLGIGVASVISAVALGVHWGNVILSGMLLLMSVIAATAFEMMIYEITHSMIATIILSFGIVWWLGYLGGTFETYMFSSWPETVKLISPLYHTNRALVELSSGGHSDYILSSVIFLGAITVISSLIAIFVGSLRRKERA
jgi:ABC-2 type transport system permease protein